MPLDAQARYAIDGKRISIAIPYPRGAGTEKVWFFAKTENVFRYAAPQSARRTGNWLVVTGDIDKAFDGRIDGLLRFNDAQGLEVRAMPGVVPAGGDPVSVLGGTNAQENLQSGIGFGWVLGLAVLGGLLLNLMPCVFPILGLKALAIAKAGGDERNARRDALAYTAGIVLSCIALGAVMLALRAAGEEIGWAFQLQDPAIVLLLLLLMVAVTANLAGLFEVGGIGAGDRLTRQGGVAGSFWTGVLAAVVATPCTGPFMAAAMGAALLLPTAQALLIFAGLGFGLALPFLAIAYIPALRSQMPKPGPWMDCNFRKMDGGANGADRTGVVVVARAIGRRDRMADWRHGGRRSAGWNNHHRSSEGARLVHSRDCNGNFCRRLPGIGSLAHDCTQWCK